MSIYKNVAVRKKLTDYIAHCARGIELVEHAYDTLDRAKAEFEQIGNYVLPGALSSGLPHLEQAKAEIYGRAWHRAFDATGLRQLMDAQAEKEFSKSLERNPPPFTLENVQSTFVDMASQADMMFQRGIVNVFRWLSTDYARHRDKPFEVPERIIVRSGCQVSFNGGRQVNHYTAARFNDIDRVFKVLDEQHYEPRALEFAMNKAWRVEEDFDDSYYHAKSHKNGNVHLKFKRPDLLAKVNDLIADYYGPRAVGDEQKTSRRAA